MSESTQKSEPRTQSPGDCEQQILAQAEELGRRLRARGMTLGTAESCTGGGLADAITDVSGSSDYFLGAIVAYANSVKQQLLGVEEATLAAHGAVSEPVAVAMAEGVRRTLGVDLGIGITGVAGPGGGTPDKPVGLVYVALASSAGVDVRRCRWGGDRIANKRRSVEAALQMLLAYLDRLPSS